MRGSADVVLLFPLAALRVVVARCSRLLTNGTVVVRRRAWAEALAAKVEVLAEVAEGAVALAAGAALWVVAAAVARVPCEGRACKRRHGEQGRDAERDQLPAHCVSLMVV